MARCFTVASLGASAAARLIASIARARSPDARYASLNRTSAPDDRGYTSAAISSATTPGGASAHGIGEHRSNRHHCPLGQDVSLRCQATFRVQTLEHRTHRVSAKRHCRLPDECRESIVDTRTSCPSDTQRSSGMENPAGCRSPAGRSPSATPGRRRCAGRASHRHNIPAPAAGADATSTSRAASATRSRSPARAWCPPRSIAPPSQQARPVHHSTHRR